MDLNLWVYEFKTKLFKSEPRIGMLANNAYPDNMPEPDVFCNRLVGLWSEIVAFLGFIH